MDDLDLKTTAEDLIDTFLEAGKIAKKICQRGVKVTIKADKSPVTDADIAVDELLKNKIKSLTPNIPIISEETVDLNIKIKKEDKTFWLIDPIDGTRDYINKRDEYTLNAALIIDLKPAIGIVYAPAKKRLFYSYGNGFSFERFEQNKIQLECRKKSKLGEVHAVTNSSKPSDEILKTHKKFNVKNFISMRSSYKFCVIAAGEFDLYAAKARAYEWDIAAGHLIVKNAGGIVTTLDEKKFKYGKADYKNLTLLVRRSEKLER